MSIRTKFDVKQMAYGAIAFAIVMVIPKVGDAVSSAIGKVRAKIAGRA